MIGAWRIVLLAILSVVLVRAFVVYSFGILLKRFSIHIPTAWLHVINWSGLRGAISLALVASLPSWIGSDRELLALMTFGVVLFTLLVQSTTMSSLIHRLRLITSTPDKIEFEKRHARLTAARAALKHLEQRNSEGLISSHAWDLIKPQLVGKVDDLTQKMRDVLKSAPDLQADELLSAHREGLRAQRSALLGLRHDGMISQDVFDELATDDDTELEII